MRTPEERAFLHDVEPGRGKRVALLVAALFALALVIWTVAMGFRNRHYGRSVGALARPFSAPVQPTAP
jgi:hypothetical protein